MAARAVKITSLPSGAEQMLVAMDDARRGTLALVAPLGDEDLERVHSPIMSPLAWDLGHIAAYEDLWLGHRYGGLELLRPDLAHLYDAFETPRMIRGEIDALRPADAKAYMAEVSARVSELICGRGIDDGVLCEMVLRHELQHCETMRQTLAIAGLLAEDEQARIAAPLSDEHPHGWLTVRAGPFEMGAGRESFAYDNERPRHTVDVDEFAIARRPVSNASWLHFSEGGGYERREWWSREGWAWKEEHDITHHPGVASGHPDAPACHVSWFEADAFARAHDARLPTEQEWEKAATWTQGTSQRDGTATAIGGAPGLSGVGRVWEWTASRFDGYPGFQAHPYREYSEVFFGDRYRVLRGSSWATHPRVAGASFRNWDLPLRRQIFAGVRLARSA
jgi:iron(II)-dependent oxidoreductase